MKASFASHIRRALVVSITVAVLCLVSLLALQARTVLTNADALNRATPPAAAQVASETSCSPAGYQLPLAIQLAGAAPGLTTIVDRPVQYDVYGASTAQIASQLQACAPRQSDGAMFIGYTTFYINWRYTYHPTASGACVVDDAQVGLHIGQIFPHWEQSSGADSATAANWQRFITSLTSHEQGHVTIDKQYAAMLLQDIQQLPPTNCTTIQHMVEAVVQRDLANVSQANDQYDSDTNHGATQGAVLIVR